VIVVTDFKLAGFDCLVFSDLQSVTWQIDPKFKYVVFTPDLYFYGFNFLKY
jgi:hypothetical protein